MLDALLTDIVKVSQSSMLDDLPTPTLVIAEEAFEQNIATTIRYLEGARRWRPHFKTARSTYVAHRLLLAGVERFKVSTLSELNVLLEAGARDILMAYPATGPTRTGVLEAQRRYPQARIGVLVDAPSGLSSWGHNMDVFLDLDPKWGRTGVAMDDLDAVVALAEAVTLHGHRVVGLHCYDGHLADADPTRKATEVGWQLKQVAAITFALHARGHMVDEVVMAGSHTYLEAIRQWPDHSTGPLMTVGAGTIVFNDQRSLTRFASVGEGKGYRAAVGLVARVVSSRPGRLTLDAGLSAVQVDAGLPHAVAVSHPSLTLGTASQEHLVAQVPDNEYVPVGTPVVLLPRHIDTTLIQFPGFHRLSRDGTLTRESLVPVRPMA